ncbi:MAG: hypothetical protein CTY22_10850 [Methylomonas sp.]|nr:MAG: hypothetical protein CTY23_09355 [Methylomonas sp.]PPD24702.1 MAG: hypothetical protein CTY22_10850 [Methylomonas sp.]PPD33241.1 MAG: hypothetical protein CTY21_10830 [Methylomonas sp.]PPD41182.1 MAG: hypothetical protein CTY17_04485 [Methylomonas sp.]PPD54753.1 MAG: hypothetical protein CTY11_02925 [Methylomonas sp.]
MTRKTMVSCLFAALTAASVHADVKLEDNSKILGKWRVTAEAAGLDRDKKALNVTWDFQPDGTLMTTGEDTVGRTKEMEIAIKYSVVDGIIRKQASPGREKYEDCAVIELDGKNMILKCKYLHFFLTRK